MQIDTKIDPRWCEALLGMLEGDLNYNRVAEVKHMLRVGIDSIRKSRPEAPSTGSLDEKSNIRKRAISRLQTRGCLFAVPGRGDCENYTGFPGKSIPGKHDGNDDTVDEYGRPNGWCEVCWRGRQIQFLEHALFESSKNYGGQAYAEEAVRVAKSAKAYTAYVIESKRLTGSGYPLYLQSLKSDDLRIWNPDVDKALQFCRRIDAERYMGKNDGIWEIVEHGFCD